ncbi:hypothetical protein M0R45_009688 [Rubus argutus]|uniref:Uncharacterized protein n=1 Tax=Rubus argutus TaxID=59490 RepID=A0AAW1Y579_RUBAR
MGTVANDHFQVERQNLTIGFQYYGVQCANSKRDGFAEARIHEPYRPPYKKGLGMPSSTVIKTPFQSVSSGASVARISLNPSKRVLFFESGSGTPVSGVGAPMDDSEHSSPKIQRNRKICSEMESSREPELEIMVKPVVLAVIAVAR